MIESEIRIGTPVLYYRTKDDKPIETKITSEPWKLGHGQVVCKVEGISGGVAIDHLVNNSLEYRFPWGGENKSMTNDQLAESDFGDDLDQDDMGQPDYWGCYSCGHTAYPKPMGARCPKCDSIMEEEWF